MIQKKIDPPFDSRNFVPFSTVTYMFFGAIITITPINIKRIVLTISGLVASSSHHTLAQK